VYGVLHALCHQEVPLVVQIVQAGRVESCGARTALHPSGLCAQKHQNSGEVSDGCGPAGPPFLSVTACTIMPNDAQMGAV